MNEARHDDEIYAVGYRKLGGERLKRWAPWPIARTALELAWRKRATKVAVGLCTMVFSVVGMVLVSQVLLRRLADYAGKSMSGMAGAVAKSIVGDTHEALSSFLGTQMFCTAILLGIAVGGIVADDRRTGAMELYFSRPLSRMDYAIGKLLAATLIPTATIVVPFLVLWIAAVGIAPGEISQELYGLVVPGLFGALIATALLATTIVGVSSAGERGRTVAILYVTLFVVLASAGSGLAEAGYDWAGYIAPQRNLQTVSDELLGVGGISMTATYLGIRHDTNPSAWISGFALLGYIAAGLGLFAVQLRKWVVG